MSKSIKLESALIKEVDGKLIIKTDTEELDLLQEISKFKDVEFVNLKLNKTRKGGGMGRKPVFKYQCPSCNKEVKSEIENLEIKCVDCDEEFISL